MGLRDVAAVVVSLDQRARAAVVRPRVCRLRAAVAAASAAVLTLARAVGARWRSSRRTTKTAPAVTLTCEDYGLVSRLAENNQHPRVRLDLDAALLGEQSAFNTIGMIKGTEKPDEYVMLSAHFDSWDSSSGATDNGTGTLMAMEAMRILKQVYPHPKRTILVGHWASEEQGLNGSTAFTEMHPEVLKGLQALYNQDNGTGRVVLLASLGSLGHRPPPQIVVRQASDLLHGQHESERRVVELH